jgi:L-ascorbate metabolism protein UlaG (beta-lactamase superfamily)
MKRFLKRTLITLVVLLVVFGVGLVVFVNTAPQFGLPPNGEHKERLKDSPHYRDGVFVNLIETKMGSFAEMMATLPDFLFGKNQSPQDTLPTKYTDGELPALDSLCYVTWYGHSAFLLELHGKRILIDPMLGGTPGPVSFGSSRFPNEEPVPLEDLRNIDLVILSHDHYDHLDYESILRLKDHVTHFYTALGVGSHLRSWGISERKITELDWWEEAYFGEIKLVACPARHFSGRGLFDRNATQWASWVIQSAGYAIYFSGDGGYGPHFKEIGERHGPFDFAMLECGQYNGAWHAIHMFPEESVEAARDLGAKLAMPIHWGAFNLAVHTWTDPIRRFKAAAQSKGVPVVHPFIGERFRPGVDFPAEEWWTDLN